METKHTKGNWEFRKWDGEDWPEKRWSVGTKETAICISPRYFTEGEESEANAKLIAAAPELLEALIKVKKDLLKYWPHSEWVEFSELTGVDRVIKKVTK